MVQHSMALFGEEVVTLSAIFSTRRSRPSRDRAGAAAGLEVSAEEPTNAGGNDRT